MNRFFRMNRLLACLLACLLDEAARFNAKE
jgi:hypothetical protein